MALLIFLAKLVRTIINHSLSLSSSYISNSTSLRQTPESITAWIFSLGPSDKWEIAQHASASTSPSRWNKSLARTGKHGDTLLNSTGGFFPRHRFDKAQTAFLVIVTRLDLDKSLNNFLDIFFCTFQHQIRIKRNKSFWRKPQNPGGMNGVVIDFHFKNHKTFKNHFQKILHRW